MSNIYDLIIVGGGPAALSAMFYALAKRMNVVMIYEELGGKVGWRQRLATPEEELSRFDQGRRQLGEALQHDIVDLETDYLPGNEVVRLLIGRTAMQAGQVVHDRVVQVTRREPFLVVQTRGHGVLNAAAVIVATGATPISLMAAGGHRRVGQGIGYSMTTYAHLVAGKRVAVIGDTQRALRGAAELARTVERLFLITPAAGSANPLLHALREQANVENLVGFEVVEVIGANLVAGLVVERAHERRTLAVDRVFADRGLQPNSDVVKDLAKLDQRGFIVVDQDDATDVPGLFAAGDVTTTFGEQVLIAVGEGTRAAMSAYDYLLEWWLTGDIPTEHRDDGIGEDGYAPLPPSATEMRFG
jgi:thioredoxin reductase (NADPH)